MKFAKRMSNLGTETAFEVLAQINGLRAQGRSVISFAIGEPDFDTPDHIKKEAKGAIDRNETHYTPSAGILPLRESIAFHLHETRGVRYSPDEIVVVPGGKPTIFFTILALVDEGDEVIYPSPGYPIYESAIEFVGGKAVPLPLLESRQFSFEVKALRDRITDKTKGIIINSPQNPTGGIIPPQDLAELAKIARERDLWILTDEIYSRIVFERKFESIVQFPGMKERCIILDGHSKTYAMTGWRLGFGAMPVELARMVAKLVTNSVSCTATFTQYAGMAALKGSQVPVDKMVAEFRQRRDLVVSGLNSIEGVSCLSPAGAFYVFPNVTGVCRNLGFKNAKMVQDYLLYEGGVGVLGRQCFGRPLPEETDHYIRLSYATSQKMIGDGISRMKGVLEDQKLAAKWLAENKHNY